MDNYFDHTDVPVSAILPFWRYAVGPSNTSSMDEPWKKIGAKPFYRLNSAKKFFAEVQKELPWCGAILYKRKGWSGVEVLLEYRYIGRYHEEINLTK